MSIHERYSTVNTWAAADTTIGKAAFVSILAKGSAADSTVTILDGTDIKFIVVVGSTVNNVTFIANHPTAFRNMVVDLTGTASYSIVSIPTTS